MKLSEWAHIAEITGAIAIVASLIFVGLELRENTQVTQLDSDRAVDLHSLILNLTITQSTDFAEILVRGEMDRDSLTAAERIRFDNYCFSRFGSYENLIGNFTVGFVPDEEIAVWIEHFDFRFNKPGYRQFWVEYRNGYFPNFRAWADDRYGIVSD